MRLSAGFLAITLIFAPGIGHFLQADELDLYLASQARLLEDLSLSKNERAGIALEMASALDRAAGRAATLDDRLGRWERAITILDDFSRSSPGAPQTRTLQAQAAVFQWAIGSSRLLQVRLNPTDTGLRQRAVEALDRAVERLQELLSGSKEHDGPLASQIRIRLAQALRDRSELDPEGSQVATERRTRALDVLKDPGDMGDLADLAHLERARLLADLDRGEKALKELDAIGENPENLPRSELLDVRVRTLLRLGRFSDAETWLKTRPESPERERLGLELALERWSDAVDQEDAAAQKTAEAAAFQHVRALQSQGGDGAIEALLRLSSTLSEPSDDLPAADLDLLAQGRLRSGRSEEASRLELRASEAARAKGKAEEAANYRLRAAGILLQSNHRIQALHLLNQIADDEAAGPLRAKAALLAGLAQRSRSAPGARPDQERAYQSALARLIERFPQTTEANEARWLLGLARQREDDASAASALWEQIPEGHPRWFEAQMARAEVRIDAIESSLVEGDQRTAEQQRLEAREALDQLDAKVTSEEARADLVLARARLETLPNLGDPKRAIDGLERLLTQPLRPDRRGLAERLRVLALLELGRSVEAVRVTRALLESSNPRDLLQLARRLDQAAVSAPSDLLVRRFGEVLRMVSTHLVEHPRGLSESLQAEARLRGLRGLVFHGDSGAAREGLKSWPQALEVLPPEVQPDLARLALDAGDPQRALQVNRAILSRQPAGSRPWLQARLGEAEALVELRELDSARRLLDATATLHPDLGGERLHRRYQALLERLEQEQAFRSSPHH